MMRALTAFSAIILSSACAIAQTPPAVQEFLDQSTNSLKLERDVNGKLTLGMPGGLSGLFPDFKCSEKFDRPKCGMRSLLLREVGDSVDLSLESWDGTRENPVPLATGYPVGFAYWLAGHVENGVGVRAPTTQCTLDGVLQPMGGNPCYGRGAEIYARTVGTASGTNRAMALVMSTTKENEVSTRERAWLSPGGTFVVGGRSSYEAGYNSYPIYVRYPDWAGGQDRGAGVFSMVQGKHDSDNTHGEGNIFIVASDEGVGIPAVTICKYGQLSSDKKQCLAGYNLTLKASDNDLVINRIVGGNKIAAARVTAGGIISLGLNGAEEAMRINSPAAGERARIEVDPGVARTDIKAICSTGEPCDIRFLPQGITGRVWFGNYDGYSAPQTKQVLGYIKIRDENGTERKLAVIE